jgi:hypothetical protein
VTLYRIHLKSGVKKAVLDWRHIKGFAHRLDQVQHDIAVTSSGVRANCIRVFSQPFRDYAFNGLKLVWRIKIRVCWTICIYLAPKCIAHFVSSPLDPLNELVRRFPMPAYQPVEDSRDQRQN